MVESVPSPEINLSYTDLAYMSSIQAGFVDLISNLVPNLKQNKLFFLNMKIQFT